MTRSLVEEGVVRVREGELSLARDLATVTVPDRVQDVLMARLDRLDEGPKRAIQIASVIGREFALRLLQRLQKKKHSLKQRKLSRKLLLKQKRHLFHWPKSKLRSLQP